MSGDNFMYGSTAIGVLGSAWWAGAMASMSLYSVPAALQTGPEPRFALAAWESVYSRGAATGPKVALVAFASLIYVSYDQHGRAQAWKPFLLAGALNVAIVPFTKIFMVPTNNALLAAAKAETSLSWAQAQNLILKWQRLNFVRSLLPLIGSLIGIWHSVGV